MLVRAARRKAQFEGLQTLSLPSNTALPWLYPAHTRWQQKRQTSSIDTKSKDTLRKRRNSQDGIRPPQSRSLATSIHDRVTLYDDIPFEGLGLMPSTSSPTPKFRDHGSLAHLKAFNPQSTLMLSDSVATAPTRLRTANGIGGDQEEMEALLQACLAVGRLDRAAAIIRRLAGTLTTEPAAIVGLHNQYIAASIVRILGERNETTANDLHKYFELEIRGKRLDPDAETIALMLKASLQSTGSSRERKVRRYLEMIGGDTTEGEVFGMYQILTNQDLHHITEIAYSYEFTEDMDEASIHTTEESLSETSAGEVPTVISEEPVVVPEVRAVLQKGLGLRALKESLAGLNESRSDNIDDEAMMRERQTRLEDGAVGSAVDRWREESMSLSQMGLNTALKTKSLGARMWKWQAALEARLREELHKVDLAEAKEKMSQEDSDRCTYGPFLRYLPVDKLAAVTILSSMTVLSVQGVEKGLPLANTIMNIGNNIEDESTAEILRRDSKKIWANLSASQRESRLNTILKGARQAQQHAIGTGQLGKTIKNLDGNRSVMGANLEQSWPVSIKAKIGACLMSALIDVAKIPVTKENPKTGEMITQMQPAFSHGYQFKLGKKMGVVLANQALIEQLKREPVHALLAKHLPMIVAPEPWSRFNKGGFISHPAKIMRIKGGDKHQRFYIEAAIARGDMEQTFKGLDVLGKTSWKINQPVFDVMLEAWNSGKAIADIPAESPEFTYPPEPEPTADPTLRRNWIRDVKAIENARSGYHSQRCFQNFQLEIARSLRNERFYFPHNVDFRGRAYPIPPYLNHMGADNCRGLLMFGKGKPLGHNGLKWLKVHLANVFGYDKASLVEREDWTDAHMAEIEDSVAKPLLGQRWWLNAEDPWQCLAACVELKNALASENPAEFVSHLPIHQDGTCNGLQHYAALGGDQWGAEQVNLVPGDRPADVYSAVANLVKESLAKDLAKGNPYAKLLDGKITRKIVKQTVMTNVYGVTFIGAKAQVRKQLLAAHPDLPIHATLHVGHLSSYIATKIFQALSTMFKGAHDIQYWLGECASRISTCVTKEQMERFERDKGLIASKVASKTIRTTKDRKSVTMDDYAQFKSSVIWTTPLHMPVVQPYRQGKSRVVTTHLQKIHLSEPHQSDPVSKRKQLQGFPPNFVHSLDATHMLLSALRCDELGLSFAAVHDSFWTHASDVETMGSVLRDAFIRIHGEDVIGRLAAEFDVRYKGCLYLAKLRPDSAVFSKISAFRKSYRPGDGLKGHGLVAQRARELLLEHKRMKLLQSEDPAEIEAGKNMVTPASIFQDMAAEEDLEASEDLADMGMDGLSPREAALKMDQEIEVGDLDNVDAVRNPLPGGRSEDAAIMEGEVPTETPGFIKKLGSTYKDRSKDRMGWIWLPLTFPPVPKKVFTPPISGDYLLILLPGRL